MPDSVPNQEAPQLLSPGEQRSARGRRIRIGCYVAGVVFLVGIVTGFLVIRVTATRNARHLASEVPRLLDQDRWAEAEVAIREAQRLRPRLPEVQRAVAEFILRGGGDARSALSILQGLANRRGAALEDRIRAGQAALQSGSPADARRRFEKLAPAERENPSAQKLLAGILRAEGRAADAATVLRTALEKDNQDPESRFELAVLNLQAEAFEERETGSMAVIWEIAALPGRAGQRALEFLATKTRLSGPEAVRLRQLAANHPFCPPRLGYQALTAYLRVFPSEIDAFIEQEAKATRARPFGEWSPFLRWLAGLGRHAEIVRFVPESVALNSRELFLIRADALLATQRHQDLERILTSSRALPVDEVFASLMLVECLARSGATAGEVSKRIELVYQTALATSEPSKHASTILRAAELAESKGLWDVAERGYVRLTGLDSSSELALLEKIYEMHLRRRDGKAMLAAAEKLRELQPGNKEIGKRINYLRLVLGIGIEKAWAELNGGPQVLASTVEFVGEQSHSDALLAALALHRLGARRNAASVATNFPEPKSLLPGQRAVAAGLFAWLGDPRRANQYLEHVPGLLLLPEEARFLRWLQGL